MEKGVNPGLFINDGSFLEKFKQLEKEQQEKQKGPTQETKANASVNSVANVKAGVILNKRPLETKASDKVKSAPASSSKLAFSLKQKSKVVAAPVMLDVEEEDEGDGGCYGSTGELMKRQRLGHPCTFGLSNTKEDGAPAPPNDPAVRKAADNLANFVAKNGKQFEHITRQKNPGDTPFKFLFDSGCSEYKYYAHRLQEEEKILLQTKDSPASHSANVMLKQSNSSSKRSSAQQHCNYQTPASALYGIDADGAPGQGEGSSGPSSSDPIAMMEFYMKKAALEERMRQPRQSKDEMPPPASLQASSVKRGHHMGDYIPPEELEKFMSACSDASVQKASKEAASTVKIQADNVGHRLLSKMGWKEGEGLGASRSGRADPVMAGGVKKDNLGVGAQQPGEVTPEDDIYEQYKKRMMLGYRYRPNPLGNPRKAYY